MSNHKQWISEVFDRAAPQYGEKSSSFFNEFGQSLVEQLVIAPGPHALDVATGRGAVLFPLAKAVGPSGKVIGIDISPQMVKETSKEVQKRNLHWVELHCMDAEQLSFPDSSFDLVFCGFALFFLPSIETALAEFKRVLKADGKLLVSTWGKSSELGAWIKEETEKLGHIHTLTVTQLWNPEILRQTLEKAGFQDIQIVEVTKTFSHRKPEEWWESLWHHATRAKFEQLSPDQLAPLHEGALKKAASLDKGQGISETLQAFYGIAKKGK